jgi:hypothetical protein
MSCVLSAPAGRPASYAPAITWPDTLACNLIEPCHWSMGVSQSNSLWGKSSKVRTGIIFDRLARDLYWVSKKSSDFEVIWRETKNWTVLPENWRTDEVFRGFFQTASTVVFFDSLKYSQPILNCF